MGHRCLGQPVCAWPKVCVCFLSVMAPNSLLQLNQSSLVLNGPGWRPPTIHPPFFSSTVGLSSGWTWVKNPIMKFKTSRNTMLRLHVKQAWCFLDSSFFLCSSLYPSVASDLPQQIRRLKFSRLWLYCWVLKVLIWQVEKNWREVMWLPHSPQPRQSPSSVALSPSASCTQASSLWWCHSAELLFVE